MPKLDLKDRKILYQLDLNCRQSNTQIGKKVGLKKDVVSYRIKRMQDEGIIKNFWTAINTFKLGYNVYRVYVNFQYVVSTDKKNEIIEHFKDYKNAWAVLTVKGPIDFDAVLWVKDVYDFYQFWDRTLEKYEEYFAQKTLSMYIETIDYKKTYLLLDDYDDTDRELYKITCGGKTVDIDEIDRKILDELAINARIPLIDLAEKLKCSSQKINYRIKNLIDLEVIKAFRVAIDPSVINLQNVKVDIYLKQYSKRKELIDYVKKNPYMFCLNTAVGWCDLEFEFMVENVDKLIQILEDIDQKFPNTIRKQDYWLTKTVHKERWLPEY